MRSSVLLLLLIFGVGAHAATQSPTLKPSNVGAHAIPATESSKNIKAFDPSKAQARRPGPKKKYLQRRSSKNELCPVEIVPGKSFGPLKLGMAREELEKLRLPARLQNENADYVSANENQFTRGSVGPFYVQLTNDKLTLIRAEFDRLPDCIQVGQKTMSMNDSISTLSKKLTTCKANEKALECKDGLTVLSTRSGLAAEIEESRTN